MFIIAAAAAIAALPASGVPLSDLKVVKSVAPVCQRVKAQTVAKPGGPTVHRLDKEPAADLYSAVLFSEGYCTKPVIIGRDIGLNPKQK